MQQIWKEVLEMGLFHVKGHLTGPTARVEEVEFLVDTGATLSVLPRSLAERLDHPAGNFKRMMAPITRSVGKFCYFFLWPRFSASVFAF